MKTCSEQVHPDIMLRITQSAMVQSQERGPWLCPLNIETALSQEQEEELLMSVTEIPKEVLRKAQEVDPEILAYLRSKLQTDFGD